MVVCVICECVYCARLWGCLSDAMVTAAGGTKRTKEDGATVTVTRPASSLDDLDDVDDHLAASKKKGRPDARKQ